jgi:hypothetical protein
VREPTARSPIFGVMAEFGRPEQLLDSVRKARQTGFRHMDAYTPFPIDGLAEELGFHDRRVPWLTLLGGLIGAAIGYGMQLYTNLAYPINIGSRPLVATPAFLLITFELTVLLAVLFSIGGMLALNHLPRLHHPVFDLQAFHLATKDKFFLVIFSNDELFQPDETRSFLRRCDPVRIEVIPRTEEPE